MFQFLKNKLAQIYSDLTLQLQSIFGKGAIDATAISQIRELLLKADTGISATTKITAHLEKEFHAGRLQKGSDVKKILYQELSIILNSKQSNTLCRKDTITNTKKDKLDNNSVFQPTVFLLVGINGSGKTTFAGKLAYCFIKRNQTCLLAAADTFRAAATQQIAQWAKLSGADLISGKPNQDPASVAFDACQKFKLKSFDKLIIDTAGRLQTKENLMHELEKIKRIITKNLPDHKICTLLTVDSMLGQNSFQQAKIFNEVTNLDGIILTKMDGSAKGGIIFSITQELDLPVLFISWGEHIEDMAPFDAELYIANLLGEPSFISFKNQ